MLWIDGQVVSRFGVDEPRELHDRATSSVDDDSFDVLGVSFNAVTLSRHEDDLRRSGRGLRSLVVLAHRVHVWRVGRGWSCVAASKPETEGLLHDPLGRGAYCFANTTESRFVSGCVSARVKVRVVSSLVRFS